jgi:hypothetical protein
MELQARESNCLGIRVFEHCNTDRSLLHLDAALPATQPVARSNRPLFVGIALLGASLPYRKSIALAIDFLIDPEQKDPAG